MGKKSKKLGSDGDGYVCTGIYSYFVGTRESHPEEYEANLRHRRRSVLESADDLFSRVRQRLEEIINERNSELKTAEERKGDLVRCDANAALLLLQSVANLASLPVDELATRDGSLPKQLIHYLFQLGEMFERVQVRKHEPAVFARKSSDAAIRKINGNRDREKLRREAEEALVKAEHEHPGKGKTVQQTKAAESLGIKRRAIQSRLNF